MTWVAVGWCASTSDGALKQRIAACTSCHGEQGQGGSDGFNPRLAGKPVGYLEHQIENFKKGRRRYPMMQYTVRGLSPKYIHAIAAYFAAQEVVYVPHPPQALSPSLMARGKQLVEQGDSSRQVPACVNCHGVQLTGVEPAVPGLIGLPYDYISAQFGSWRTNTRATIVPDCMAAITQRLQNSDITALAGYLASQPIPIAPVPQPKGSTHMPMRCGSSEAD